MRKSQVLKNLSQESLSSQENHSATTVESHRALKPVLKLLKFSKRFTTTKPHPHLRQSLLYQNDKREIFLVQRFPG